MAVEKAGILLVAENYQNYMAQLDAIDKKQQEVFNKTFKQTNIPAPKMPKIETSSLKSLTKALDDSLASEKKVEGALGGLGNFLSGQLTSTLMKFGGVLAGVFSINYAINFVKGLEAASVAMNSQFENFQTQFTTLLGSEEKAQKRIEELAKFNIKTPYELPQIVQASKMLQMFGGSALATGKSLEMVGDAAAAVNAPVENVSMWFGRMYSAIQSGKPFGEAAMRMQELGILSAQTRDKLENMQKTGVSGKEIWAAFANEMSTKFGGAMDKLAKTLQGVQSNLTDFQNQLIRVGGEEYFDVLKQQTIDFYKIISEDKPASGLENLAKGFGYIAAKVREAIFQPFIDSLKEVDFGKIDKLGKSFYDIGTAIGKFSKTDLNAEGINGIIVVVTDLNNVFVKFLNIASSVYNFFEGFGNVTSKVLENIAKAVNPATNALMNLNDTIKLVTGVDAAGWFDKFAGSGEEVKGTVIDISDEVNAATEKTDEFANAQDNAADAVDALKDSLQSQKEVLETTKDAYEKIRDIQDTYNEDIAKAEQEKNDALEEEDKKYAKEREKTLKDQAKEMAKFEQDQAIKRQQMIRDFNDDQKNKQKEFNLKQKQTEEEFNLKIAQDKKAFYDNQKKDQRAFQLSMMQEARAFALQDKRMQAEGDVVALMQAREDFALQQQEKIENNALEKTDATKNFEEQQELAKEQFALQEEQARESFALQTQIQQEEFQKRLADFDANLALERERRIEANAEELAELDAKHEEEKQKILEQYNEKMAMADNARGEALEKLGESLKEEGKITEEGMQDIQSKMEEIYGSDGALAGLMYGWSEASKSIMSEAILDMNNQIDALEKKMKNAKNAINDMPTTPATNANLSQGQTPQNSNYTPTQQAHTGVSYMRQGGVGVVTGPKLFEVEAGQKEAVMFAPLPTMSKGNLDVNMRGGFNIKGAGPAGKEATEAALDQMVFEFSEAVKRIGKR